MKSATPPIMPKPLATPELGPEATSTGLSLPSRGILQGLFALIAALTLSPLGWAEDQASHFPPGQVRVEDLALTDHTMLENEQEIQAMIRREVSQTEGMAGRFGAKQLLELDPREAALRALDRNLAIQRSQVAERISKAALLEAKAVFDPVLLLSFSFDRSETFTRIERDQRFRPATRVDDQDRDVVGSEDPVDPRSPLAVFVDPQVTRDESTRVVASQESITGPTETFTYDLALEQPLPWGTSLELFYQAIDQDTFFVNNPNVFINNPNPPLALISSGSFDRSWVSSLLARFSLPLPGSKDFGPYAEQEVAIKRADYGKERAFWEVEAEINNTLLAVDLAYWDLTNSLLSLHRTIENRKGVEKLLELTRRLFDLREATNYDLAQVQAELARLQGEEERAWNNYVLTSDALVQALDLPASNLLLPTGYSGAFGKAFSVPEAQVTASHTAGNPERLAATVDVKTAHLEQRRRAVRTRPDLNFVAEAEFRQSNRRFGYESFGESLENIVDPDIITQTYSVEYLYPWGNRAVKAAFAQARADTAKQQFIERETENRLQRTLDNARIELISATERVAITARNVRLAELAYGKSIDQQQARRVTEYEIVQQSADLLAARLNHIAALTERKQAEARLLATVGILGRLYPQRLAQTDLDRYRLSLLEANGVLQHFGPNANLK